MRLLLDTYIALWAITDDARLPPVARGLVLDPVNDIHVSAASVWEIAIKHRLAVARGRPEDMPVAAAEALGWFRRSGYLLLDISAEHAAGLDLLPDLHRNPFDRILVAQALTEPLRLLTCDRLLGSYGDMVLVV